MNTPSGSLLADFASEWNRAQEPVAAAPLAAPPPAAPLPAAPSPVATLAQIVGRVLPISVWFHAAPPPAAPLSPPSPPPVPPVAAPLAAEDDPLLTREVRSRMARVEERLAGAIAIMNESERRLEAHTCDEEAQAKLRVHLTPRQSDGRISNRLGMEGWANISLAVLLHMSDENHLFEESFDPELEDDFESWSNARPEVQAQIRRIRARNSQRDEWVRHDPKSARARRYVMLKEAAREVYEARGTALLAVASCRHTHMYNFDSTHALVEALAEQAVATHALEEALARQTAKIQLVKTLGRG